MVFWVLKVDGGLQGMLKSYMAGCMLCGLASIMFVSIGSLELLRTASYAGLSTDTVDVDC